MFILFILFFKYILLIMLLQLTHFLPFISLHPTHPPTRIPPFRTCPWVVHINSLASAFPILSLTSPCLFSTYHLCYLFSVPFPPLSPSHSPVDNPPCELHFCRSVPILVVCLVGFCFWFSGKHRLLFSLYKWKVYLWNSERRLTKREIYYKRKMHKTCNVQEKSSSNL